jgi:hypothetical protein
MIGKGPMRRRDVLLGAGAALLTTIAARAKDGYPTMKSLQATEAAPGKKRPR